MEFIKSKKIDLEGKLLVSIPSEGCLGQRVVDQILTNNKCFEFVGSFYHSSLQVIFDIPSLDFKGCPMTSFRFSVVLCRIRLFPTLASKMKLVWTTLKIGIYEKCFINKK